MFIFNFEIIQLHKALSEFHNGIINVSDFNKKIHSLISACAYERVTWKPIAGSGEDGYAAVIDTRTVKPKPMMSEKS
ncbi:hypothetical protein ENUP19_0257G0033 [Entamoeba nuttalli]|uniref:Uncharacterized protein n=1 Tax=Entamoeba nuttalli TaxID=412467 RepID=A0ABQ0DRX7_9EUKA